MEKFEILEANNIHVVKPNVNFVDKVDGDAICRKLDRSARTCYLSEPKDDPYSALKRCIKSGHTSILEHVQLTYEVISDRGIMWEITRHRHTAYSIESTRYCNYGKKGYYVLCPVMLQNKDAERREWEKSIVSSIKGYEDLLNWGITPETARSTLPAAIKTKMRISMNVRELGTMLALRAAKPSHPDFKMIAIPMLLQLRKRIPFIFDSIEYDEEFYKTHLSEECVEDICTFCPEE